MLMAANATARDGVVHDALRDQLVAHLPPTARICAQGWRPWASASFVGARHWFDIVGADGQSDGPDDDAWSAIEWHIPDSFVADVAVTRDANGSTERRVEVLTVDD